MATAKKAAPRTKRGAAARSEDKPKTIKFEGLALTLPAKLPFRVLRHTREEGISGVVSFVEDVLGDEQMEKVWALDIDIERGGELMEEILGCYGMDAGESPASDGS